eukprot:g4361.t1
MSGGAGLTQFISEGLHNLLGYSDTTTVQYVAAVSKKASSAAVLLASLQGAGLPQDARCRDFAQQLFQRAARGKPAGAAPSRRPTNADMMRKSQSYALVPTRSSSAGEGAGAGLHKARSSKRHLRKRKRKRGTGDSSSSSDGESGNARGGGGASGASRANAAREDGRGGEGKASSASALTAEERAALQRERDIEERDAFAERLRARDADKTRRVGAGAGAGAGKDAAAAAASAHDNIAGGANGGEELNFRSARELSRQEYLKKREEKELDLLEFGIQDEEFLFAGEERTEAERERLRLNQRILEQARGRAAVAEGAKTEGYAIPEAEFDADGALDTSKREEALTARYEEEGELKTEQQEWEEHQMAQAKGRARKQGAGPAQGEEYEMVFEDQIEFISHEMLAGTVDEGGEGDSKSRPKTAAEKDKAEADTMAAKRATLPIFAYRDELMAAVRDNQVLVVVGETGSGKTTQIPQYLHEVGYSKVGKIGCTQPRRVAAMSVAARVSQEMGVKLGAEVGYSIRFEDCTSESTVLKYMTDGMLLREFLGEPDLASYSCMIVDEAHERTLHTDVLFGLVKDICRFRDDIKLLISSATLDAQKFSEYFDDAPIFMIPGRMYPVDIMYTKAPEADYLDAAVVTCLQVHITQPLGDVLIFLTGQEEIETGVEILTQRTKGLGSRIKELVICPIYSTLPAEQQAKIFEPTPPGARKVVLATNIAETSLTIDGICYVIDTGFSKQKSYNPRTGMESLIVTPISKAGANQRSGRAGRTAPGKCFRLYTAWAFENELDENPVPEIQRTNLGSVVLMLKSLGINDLLHFDFMDKPPPETLIRALEQLYALGALNDRGELTKLGRRMAEFPLDPQQSKALIKSEDYGCSEEILTIMSMLSIGASVFYRPKDKAIHADTARMNFARGGAGDHIALMHVYNQWAETNYSTQWCYENYVQVRSLKKARDIRDQLDGLCERVEVEKCSNVGDTEQIRKAVCAGYFYNTAKLDKSGNYKTVKHAHTVHIHPSSALFKEEERPRWMLYHELAFTSKEFMRQCIPVKSQWLIDIAPHFYKEKELEDSSTKKMPRAVGKAAHNSAR